jgi:hypothetical protein
MRPSSSNVPPVRLVLARQVLLQVAHQVLEHVDVLAPRAHHANAFHKHGPILGGQFLPVPLARVSDEAAHLGVVPSHCALTVAAVRHERQLVGGVEFDQAAGGWFLV